MAKGGMEHGDPGAVYCRHCSHGRVRVHDVLVCLTCDGVALWPDQATA